MIVNRGYSNESRSSPLFPEYFLGRKIRSPRACAAVVGSVFESATAQLLDGKRGSLNGHADICPDVLNDREGLLAESKATQTKHPFKISIDQIAGYAETRMDEARRGMHTRVMYCLWAYREKRLTRDEPTQGEIVRRVVDSCTGVHMLDLNLLVALRKLAENEGTAPEATAVRSYSSWKSGTGRDWYCLHIGHQWLRRITDEPGRVIEELGLEADGYTWRRERRTVGPLKIHDREFEIRDVDVISFVRPNGFQEHPDAEREYLAGLAEAPF